MLDGVGVCKGAGFDSEVDNEVSSDEMLLTSLATSLSDDADELEPSEDVSSSPSAELLDTSFPPIVVKS